MNIINLTPHAITFVDENNQIKKVIEPSGNIARVGATTVTVGELAGIPVTTTEFGEVIGLPDKTSDTIFLVSSLVAGRVPDRDDVFIPNESVRDDKGRIVGCKSLGRI